MSVEGLKEEVTVRRDSRGIPYIEAKNDADLYFAQGYIIASDRLWQMDLMRRLARGQTAELFGDRLSKETKDGGGLGLRRSLSRVCAESEPEMRVAMEAYAQRCQRLYRDA